MSLRIAYFINQYPMVSHSFIRREILALERQGVEVLRIALRGWKEKALGAEDEVEQGRTMYVLRDGPLALIWAMAGRFFSAPARFFSAAMLAVRMSRRSERGLVFHLAYLAEACRLLPWLSSHGASHIHAHFGTNSAEVVMLAHALGGPSYSFTAHGSETVDNAQMLGLGEKIRRAAFVVAVCSFGRSQLFRWVEHPHWAKIRVVHCGIEKAFHDVPAVPLPSAPRIVCVGRLCNQKGQLLLIEATRRLADKGLRLELVLAGDGEMRGAIDALIDEYGLRDQVRITGWIGGEQVRAEILAARALVLPSFSEGLPVVLMEAMALRRPVISTYVGGIPELVRPGENGWLVPAGSVDSLVAAIEGLLACSDRHLADMGEAAYRRVLDRHSVDSEATKLKSLFSESARITGGLTP
jgi:colanic acid/amylovoran biosynthesis glycosyltransferase